MVELSLKVKAKAVGLPPLFSNLAGKVLGLLVLLVVVKGKPVAGFGQGKTNGTPKPAGSASYERGWRISGRLSG